MSKSISVIGCGPSALECGARNAPGLRIGVNDAFRHVDVNMIVGMDGRWARYRYADVWQEKKPTFLRVSAYGHVLKAGKADKLPPHHGFVIYECDINTREFSDTAGILNGNHSGYNALNLAWKFAQPDDTVYLYGFDMNFRNGKDHFFGDYEWKGEGCSNSTGKFKQWADDMSHAAVQFEMKGVKVLNTNRQSAITAFDYGEPIK